MSLILLSNEARREHALKVIANLSLEELWAVQIEPYKSKRSLEANRRLWALHQLAAAATGHSADELHEFMKLKFLPRKFVKVGGVEREVPARSSSLNTKEFREFMEQVEAFYISELNVWLE